MMQQHVIIKDVLKTLKLPYVMCMAYIFKNMEAFLTRTNDSISRVPCMTSAVERSFGVGAVGISVTVMRVMAVITGQSF